MSSSSNYTPYSTLARRNAVAAEFEAMTPEQRAAYEAEQEESAAQNPEQIDDPRRPYKLHLIASAPSVGDRHVDPDHTAERLSQHATLDYALEAGRDYLRDHPSAWLQVQLGDAGQVWEVPAID